MRYTRSILNERFSFEEVEIKRRHVFWGQFTKDRFKYTWDTSWTSGSVRLISFDDRPFYHYDLDDEGGFIVWQYDPKPEPKCIPFYIPLSQWLSIDVLPVKQMGSDRFK